VDPDELTPQEDYVDYLLRQRERLADDKYMAGAVAIIAKSRPDPSPEHVVSSILGAISTSRENRAGFADGIRGRLDVCRALVAAHCDPEVNSDPQRCLLATFDSAIMDGLCRPVVAAGTA
jgi:hypothetical protein